MTRQKLFWDEDRPLLHSADHCRHHPVWRVGSRYHLPLLRLNLYQVAKMPILSFLLQYTGELYTTVSTLCIQ